MQSIEYFARARSIFSKLDKWTPQVFRCKILNTLHVQEVIFSNLDKLTPRFLGACSHKACRNSLWEQRLFPQSLSEQLFPQICRNRLLGVPIENKCVKGGGLLYGGLTTVPTNIVLTPNVAFLLAVPTNLSEQTTIYNSAVGPYPTGTQST